MTQEMRDELNVQELYTFETDIRGWYITCRQCNARFEIERQELGCLELLQLLEHAHMGCAEFERVYLVD